CRKNAAQVPRAEPARSPVGQAHAAGPPSEYPRAGGNRMRAGRTTAHTPTPARGGRSGVGRRGAAVCCPSAIASSRHTRTSAGRLGAGRVTEIRAGRYQTVRRNSKPTSHDAPACGPVPLTPSIRVAGKATGREMDVLQVELGLAVKRRTGG